MGTRARSADTLQILGMEPGELLPPGRLCLLQSAQLKPVLLKRRLEGATLQCILVDFRYPFIQAQTRLLMIRRDAAKERRNAHENGSRHANGHSRHSNADTARPHVDGACAQRGDIRYGLNISGDAPDEAERCAL